jgi:hypothetical protein
VRVKNHYAFAKFEYDSYSIPEFKLGDVVTQVFEHGTEVGVVIQTHEDGDLRTDMFGNAGVDQVKLSTLEEVRKYRPDLEKDLLDEGDSISIKDLEQIVYGSNVVRQQDAIELIKRVKGDAGPKFNHAFSLAFSVETDIPEEATEQIPVAVIKKAILDRLDNLTREGSLELHEAIGMPHDTYDNY